MNFLKENKAQSILRNTKLAADLTKLYIEGVPLDSWAGLVKLSRTGKANEYLEVGGVINGTYTVDGVTYDYPWIVMDFRDVELEDGSKYKNVPIIQAQYPGHEKVIFDEKEYYEATEITALPNWCYVAIDNKKPVILDLSVGSIIPYSEHEKIYKTEWNSINAVVVGENNWARSYCRQYMNNTGIGWARKTHETDILPSNAETKIGMLSYLPENMTEVLHPIKIKTKASNYMGNNINITYDKFWLASLSEMNFFSKTYISSDDGSPWDYYKDITNSETSINISKNNEYMKRYSVNFRDVPQAWWVRSTVLISYGQMYIDEQGSTNVFNTPNLENAVLPCCAII